MVLVSAVVAEVVACWLAWVAGSWPAVFVPVPAPGVTVLAPEVSDPEVVVVVVSPGDVPEVPMVSVAVAPVVVAPPEAEVVAELEVSAPEVVMGVLARVLVFEATRLLIWRLAY